MQLCTKPIQRNIRVCIKFRHVIKKAIHHSMAVFYTKTTDYEFIYKRINYEKNLHITAADGVCFL